MKSVRYTFNKHREIIFILVACLFTTAMILALMDLNSINPDETSNLFIGKTILEGRYGEGDGYSFDYLHRLPMIPSIVSLSLVSGIGINSARILIPIIFMNLLLVATYIMAKVLYGKGEAFIAALFVLTFPFFWRWGFSILTDIPLAAFSVLFLLFFYLGIERERKYLLLSALALSLGLLLKSSVGIFVIPAFLYLLIRRKHRVILTKEFIGSVVFIPVFFLSVFFVFQVFTSVNMTFASQTAFLACPWDISEVFKFILAPSLIFSVFGLVVAFMKRRKQDLFIILSGLAYLLFFVWSGHLRLRYLAPLIPIMAMLAGIGFLRLREKINTRRIVDLFFIFFLLMTSINSLYLIDLEESTLWGAEELSGYINSIEGDATIAIKYLPWYFKATSIKNIVPITNYIEFDGKRMLEDEFINAMINRSHPNYLEYLTIRKSGNYTRFELFDYEWLKERNADYFVTSIYNDYGRSGVTEYYYPMFGPFEISFIKRPYCNGRVPPDYQFQSDLFKSMEADSRFEKIKEIYKGEQRIFIVYRVL